MPHYQIGPITISWIDDEQNGKPTNINIEGMNGEYNVVYNPLTSLWYIDWTVEVGDNVKYFFIAFNNIERARAAAAGNNERYEELTPFVSIGEEDDDDYDIDDVLEDEETRNIVIEHIREHFPIAVQQ